MDATTSYRNLNVEITNTVARSYENQSDASTNAGVTGSPGTGNTYPKLVESVISGICELILLYLSTCQVAVFAYRAHGRQITLRVRKCSDLLTASNLRYLMSLTLIIASLLGTCYVTLSAVNRHIPFYRPVYSALVCCLMLSFLSMYLVLWLRQTSFYIEPAIRHLTHPVARYISLFHGVFIVGGAVVLTATEIHQVYKPECTKAGCIAKWVSVIITSSQLEIQLALLVLFVWPLIKHRQNLDGKSGRRDTGKPDKKFKSGKRESRKISGKRSKNRRLLNLVKRAVVVTAISIIIDVVSIGLYLKFQRNGTAYNVATVLNLLCTIFCFGDYKVRIFPCSINRKSIERQQSSRSSSQSESKTQEKTLSVSKTENMRLKTDIA